MAQDMKFRFGVIVVLAALCGYILMPAERKPRIPVVGDAKLKPGIDLAGGAELVYRVLYEPGEGDRKERTERATEVIRNRMIQKKLLGEPKINAQGDDQIIIQIAEIDNATLRDYKKLIEQGGKLELFAAAPKDVQERFNRDGQIPQGFRKWANDKKMDGEYDHFKGDFILLRDIPILEGDQIDGASHDQRLDLSRGGRGWEVNCTLKSEGAKRFDEEAAILFNQVPKGLIAIVLDGKILLKPRVNSPSFTGAVEITGDFPEDEAQSLAIVLRSGSLPAKVGCWGPNGERLEGKPEAENVVGPTLGQDAISRGFWASVSTIVLVSLFMIVYYRTGGFIAVITLILNLAFLLGIMALFGAVLTLPGIAGIALTVGMAVDANILVFERIREEQAKDKTASQAFEAGHERAFVTIMDSNLTTLIVAVVLYYFGTGAVKGFAVTLSIGIATTLFSVLFCGKTFMKMLIAGGVKEFRMMQILASPNLNFLGVARACVLASVVVVGAGTAFFLSRGEQNFGIDFRGGSRLSFSLAEGRTKDIDEVRQRIMSIRGEGNLTRYPDAEVQTLAEPGKQAAGRVARHFQLRTGEQDLAQIREDLQKAFADSLSHVPFEDMAESDVDRNPRFFTTGAAGRGWFIHVREQGFSLDDLKKKAAVALKGMLRTNPQNEPIFHLEETPGAAAGLKKLKLLLTKEDAESGAGDLRRRVREKLDVAFRGRLSEDPFTAQGQIRPAVAKELRDSTVWAMVVSWALMIVYIAFRFASWKYGVAAVAALVHDALVAVAFTSLAGALIPKSWGLSFEMNMTTMAAILTVIGYSINDTIVIFDRIRENLLLMKKDTFRAVINASVNQTMSRTILTALTVWISAIVLYVFTMSTGGGIAEFSFPLIMGVIAGTYSTIWIASPIVLWWYRGERPQTP
jgi:SecD/SecF fusion protein